MSCAALVRNCRAGSSVGAKTYVVGSLRDVAEGWRGELGDDLLNPDVFRHDGGGWSGSVLLRVRGVGVVVIK